MRKRDLSRVDSACNFESAFATQISTPKNTNNNRPGRVVVLVPAHNEADQIAATIESLLGQTRKPDLVVVVADNCTDDTVEIARRYPVTVMETVDNSHRKSGAMNQGWARYCRYWDYVLTMDADTTLQPDTIEALLDRLTEDPELGAVCARYWAKEATGLAWRLQRLEYARYDDTREIRNWRVQVASGAATIYRGPVLAKVVRWTGRPAPWDDTSLIEDYGLTLDIKTLGYRVSAAAGAEVLTDTPATFRELWRQRLRWGRGGIDEVRKRGWTAATRRDIAAYWLFAFGGFMRVVWLAYFAGLLLLDIDLKFSLLGLVPLGIMWIDRVTSAWRVPGRSWKDIGITAVLVVEDLYGFFLEMCTATSAINSLRSRRQAW